MKSKLIVLLVLIFAVVDTSHAADDYFNFIGAGARARGMGGAFIGLADDATAMSWNPAGLSKLEKPEASLVGLYEDYKVSTDLESFDVDIYKSSHFNLNFASVAFPLSVGARNLVAGIAYQQVSDLYDKYTIDTYHWEQTGGIYAITPAIGLQLTPSISIGATVNIYTGKTNSAHEYLSNPSNDYKEEFTFSGINFNIGALLDFDRFRIGAVLKTPFGLKQEYDGLDSENYKYNLTFGIPQKLGFGASFLATENLTLAADYEIRNYAGSKIEHDEDGAKYDAAWKDINQFRLGAEYLLKSGTNIIPLRLGFATAPSLFADYEDNQVIGNILTAGIGIIMGNINLDLTFEYKTTNNPLFDSSTNQEYERNDNYLRFIVGGVFHFGE
ncbi:MAG TPA: hypothetical protein VGD14_11070 [bacterium]